MEPLKLSARRAWPASAIKARTQAVNQLRSPLVTAPESLRARFRGIGTARRLVDAAARLRPGADLSDPCEALKATLRHLARRYQLLDEEITELDKAIHLCGTAPIPASSGKRDRHRLNRAGDRQANRALHTITIVRMRHDERTRAYVERHTAEGLSKKEIIRCLKRHIARETYKSLTRENRTVATTTESHTLTA
jgi:hypothetical protein